MNEPISLTYHQAQAVAERAARVLRLARQHKGYGVTERTRVVVFIGNPYYTEPNPALHGLYLKVEGSGAPVPLFANDLGYERNFEAARLPARDEYGHVQHPDMDGIGWDEFDMGPQLRAIGWESTTICFESDTSHEQQERYDEGSSPDCSYWTPSRPGGAGWLLAAIYDTEDGPVALYVRPADGVQAAPAPQIDESKLPPRPIGSNDADTDPGSPLVRYGRATPGSGVLLEPMADGYWTPWHIANEMLREAQRTPGVDLPVGGTDGR